MTSVNIRPNETSVALSSVVPMNGRSAEVKTNKIKGSAQTNRAGLGYGPSKHKRRIPSGPKGEREQMLRVFTEIEEEAGILRALTQKKHFSEWLKWQCALAVDLSWQQGVLGLGYW